MRLSGAQDAGFDICYPGPLRPSARVSTRIAILASTGTVPMARDQPSSILQKLGAWPFVVALGGVLVAHLRGIDGAFLSDDYVHLGWIYDASERGALWLWAISRLYTPLDSGNFAYRPLAFATYVLDWLVYGAHATGWHVTNMALHCANAALAGILTARWLNAQAPHPSAGGWITACVLAAFPFTGEVSFWPVGRFDLLACLFSLLYLLTLPIGASPMPSPWRRLRLAWLACALLSKESAMPLPAVATLLCFAATSPGGAIATERFPQRVNAAFRETWPTWLAFAVYLLWRAALFGSMSTVYPDSSFPASVAEFAWRVATFRYIVSETLGPGYVAWSVAATALMLASLASWWRARRVVSPECHALAIALLGAALIYVVAPTISFRIAGTNGEGARNLYVGWMYSALAIGVLLAWKGSQQLIGIAFVAVLLIGQWRSLGEWQDAGRRMKEIVRSVEHTAAGIDSNQYALLYLPDHYGTAPFARNAQGAIVMRPTQHEDFLDRMAGMTSSGFKPGSEHLRNDTIAKLKSAPRFDRAGFLGLYCWNVARQVFVPLPAGDGTDDPERWQAAARANFDAAGCMPPF